MMTLTAGVLSSFLRPLSAHIVYNIFQRKKCVYFVKLKYIFIKWCVLKYFPGMGGENIFWECMRKIGAE